MKKPNSVEHDENGIGELLVTSPVQKPSKTALGLHSGAALKDEIMLRFKSHASSIAKRGKRWLLKLVTALILLIIC